jgi:glucose/arabinose dehydrogenase
MRNLFIFIGSGFLLALTFGSYRGEGDLSKIKLPPGFSISIYADDVPNARTLLLTDSGVLFVGTRNEGSVYAVLDDDGDFVADRTFTLASGLKMPNGIAYRDGSLYVAETTRIWRLDDIEANLENPPEPIVIRDGLPEEGWHGWRYMKFGPDGLLYVSIGAPCNVCEPEPPHGTIVRMKPDGTDMEIYASGIRNSVGFSWHPVTGELWFTDNGRDNLGDDVPPDELNRAPVKGMDFGYPYFHGGTIPDPEFGQGRKASDYTLPARTLGPHVASLGLEFYTGDMFPSEYRNQILIAEHGSWNRSKKIGYRVSLVRLDENSGATSYETFASGWLQGEKNWGRPVDLEQMPDGSLLLSDDQSGTIYRITYDAD